MLDTFGRDINYLRLSVTDLCNYRCRYCMPKSGAVMGSHADILSFEEYLPIIEAAVFCGISKIRITGGEPLMRNGLSSLCTMIKNTAGVRELAITTNGSLLPQFAQELKDAGVDRLNISLDTLNSQKFAHMTEIGTLADTLDGISAAKAAGFQNLKLNTVLIGGFNDDEIGDFVELTRDDDISVRFIELMPMHTCAEWPESCFLSADAVLAQYPELSPVGSSGAAELYQMPGYRGTVGLIRPMSRNFCSRCSRIRITADGKLKPCLHSQEEIPLCGLSGEELKNAIIRGITCKPASHHMTLHSPSQTARAMHQIGG